MGKVNSSDLMITYISMGHTITYNPIYCENKPSFVGLFTDSHILKLQSAIKKWWYHDVVYKYFEANTAL